MNDEEAKAAQEIAKATGKGIDAVQGVGRFLKQVLGDACNELGQALHDWTKFYRYKNLIKIHDKVHAIHTARRLEGKPIPIPPRYAVPMLERASTEDDEVIQNMWAALIANVTDPTKRINPRKVYIDILSSLEPLDAAVLDQLNVSTPATIQIIASRMRFQDEGIEDEEVWLSLQNLARLGCIRQEKQDTWDETSKMGFDVSDASAFIKLTDLGISLLTACEGFDLDNTNGE